MNDSLERLVSALFHFVTICVCGRWIYVAHKNLPALGAENLRFRPGLAVGSFFIPIYNLWGPFQAVVFRMSMGAKDVNSLSDATIASIVMSMLSIPLYLLARQIVLRVRRDQNAAMSASL